MQTRMLFASLSALVFSWIVSMILGHLHIRGMRKRGLSQPINPDGPESHYGKAGTPTIGGVFFLLGTTISVVVFGSLDHPYTFIPLIAMWAFAAVGLFDDIVKLIRKDSVGLTSLRKLGMQILVAALILWLLSERSGLLSTVVGHPWKRGVSWDIGLWYPIAFLFYMVLFVNAVNISDGLDGLATGVSFGPILLLGILAALFGNGMHNRFVQEPIHSGGFDILVVLCAALGGLLAFLWYNGPKAQVFMGDVGSHAIGALIAISALLMKVELTVLVASGVFIAECASSFLQILSIRMFNRKIFKMAPLHHHFEKMGISEARITLRFQISGAILTVVAAILFMVKYR